MDAEVIDTDQLIDEQNALRLRIDRLKKFELVPVSDRQRFLMRLQLSAMQQYDEILTERITYTSDG